jgi:uncharacterized protein YbjT (DUF2867 family)
LSRLSLITCSIQLKPNETLMTLHIPLRAPVPGADERGRRVYRVPLAKVGVSAIVDADDYEDLIARGVSGSWSWSGGTVVVGSREENTRRVARLIIDPPAGHQVRHRNRNALDLRRENLFMKQIRPRPKPTFTGQHRPL